MTLQKSSAFGVLAAAAALACAGAASAQETTYNPNDYVLLNGSAVRPDSKVQTDKRFGPGGGIKLGIPLNPSWDLQIGGNYGQSKGDGNFYRQWSAGVDALYLFTPAGFRPFVLAGVGASREWIADSDVGHFRRTSPYAQVGLGFQYKLTPHLGLQADVREQGSFYRHRINELDAKNSANTYLDLGLTWAFGAPPKTRPAAQLVETTTTTTTTTAPAPEPVVVPPPPPPAPPPLQKYTLQASELFGFDSAKLGTNQPKLDDVAQVLNTTPDIKSVTIVGYTDKLGSKPYNQKLSVERAESVKRYLVNKGVAADRLLATGKGDADPVVECADVKKRPALIKCLEPNRRVEIQPVTFTKPAQQ